MSGLGGIPCIRSNSIKEVRCAFRRQFKINNRSHVPNRKTVKLWVRHWRENGSVQNLKKPGPRTTVRTPEKVNELELRLREALYGLLIDKALS